MASWLLKTISLESIKTLFCSQESNIAGPEPATGGTWSLQADQVPGHPGSSYPSAVVEGCGLDSSGVFSIGFLSDFPQDDGNNSIDIDCQQNIGAYDPNDKTGFPLGIGSEHNLEPGLPIEYRIRFQNTGTDTAFRVVIRDTLSSLLDLGTVVNGASSHPHSFTVYGSNILQWTFDNILLPDSNVDEPGSHGFVTFKVQQAPGNTPGMVIENNAGIYFDFNDPVITNTYFHTLNDDAQLIFTSVTPGREELIRRLQVYPNPATDAITIDLGKDFSGQVTFELYDLSGTLLQRKTHGNSAKIVVEREGLQAGIYLFRLLGETEVWGTGKVVFTR